MEDLKPSPLTVSDVLQKVDIALDSYDDIFSDFDPSPFQTRLMSEDFLNELHGRHTETSKGTFTVSFTLPKALRSEKTESLVRKRIKDYFREMHKKVDKRISDEKKEGIVRIVAGVGIGIAILVVPYLSNPHFAPMLSVLSWYVLWTGYGHLFDTSPRLEKKRIFAERFMKAEYVFLDQEEVAGEIEALAGRSATTQTKL